MVKVAAWWERIGPRVRDLSGVALSVAVTLSYVAARGHGGVSRSAVLAFGLVGSFSLLWRRRFPVSVTLVGIAVVLASLVPIPIGLALFTLAVARRDRVLVLITVLCALAFAVSFRDGTSAPSGSLLLAGSLAAGFCAAAGAYIGARRDLLVSLRDRADRAEAEREIRAEQARVAERTRIAQEMHDVLAHKVSLIALHAGALEVTDERDDVRAAAVLIRTTAREAMEDLRDVLGVLRFGTNGAAPNDLAPMPGSDDIERLVAASRAAGVRIGLTMDVAPMPAVSARTVHRVVQEALTNVHKHARGAATCVSIRGDDQRGVSVDVVNQCPVGAASLLPGSGAGLIGLRERIELAGGTLDVGPTPDGGWKVGAWMPWASA